MDASITGPKRGEPVRWPWPETDELVDLRPYVLREWTEHRGDSPITLARPRKRRGAVETPLPAYLLKKGASAIGERAYYLLARLLNLPSAIVFWAAYSQLPVAAIRFEPTAWHPVKLDVAAGCARLGDRVEHLLNPLDDYRHKALYHVLDEGDDTEYMVRNHVLFRIDAASAGDALWSVAMRTMFSGLTDMSSQERQVVAHNSIAWGAEWLGKRSAVGRSVYMETLAIFAQHPEWDTLVADDLRACPARDWRMDLGKVPALDELTPSQRAHIRNWAEVPLMEHIAGAYVHTMTRQRLAIQRLFERGGHSEAAQ